MTRFSKLVLLVMAGLMVFAAAANATTTRIASLAGIDNYIADDVNLFNWYAPLTQYGDMVWIEFGDFSGGTSNPSDRLFGVSNANTAGTWAIFLQDAISSPWEYTTSIGSVAGESIYTKWRLRWAYEFASGFILGLGFDRADQETQTMQDFANNRSSTDFGAGITVAMGDNASLNAAATYSMFTYERDYNPGGNKVRISEDGNTAFDVRARIFWDWRDDTQVVPFAAFTLSQLSLKSDSTEISDSLQTNGTNVKTTTFVLGIGLNHAVNGDNMLFFGAELEVDNRKPHNNEVLPSPNPETKILVLPRFFASLESAITDWLTARAGGRHTLQRTKDQNDITVTTGEFELFFGVGFKIADFDFDLLLASYAPYQFGYFLTGFDNGSNAPFVLRITGTYHY